MGRLRAVAVWAMVLPFLLLSLIPAGVMPDRTAGSGLTLVLCTSDGPVSVVIDPRTGEPVETSGASCDWAMAQSALILPPLATVELAGTPPMRIAAPVAAAVPRRGFAAPSPLPRGPPQPA